MRKKWYPYAKRALRALGVPEDVHRLGKALDLPALATLALRATSTKGSRTKQALARSAHALLSATFVGRKPSRALHDMFEAHKGQQRRGGAPYFLHPLGVYTLLREYGYRDPDILTASLLHDIIEDTPLTPNELEQRYGRGVSALVEELTRKDRKFKLRSREAFIVKMADRINNLWWLSETDLRYQRWYAKRTRELVNEYRTKFERASPRLFNRLCNDLEALEKSLQRKS